MASINYNIQMVAVRTSLSAGETAGIEMFIPDNPHSVFATMANSYIYLALSMVSAGFAFENRGLQRWIRYIFLEQIVTAVGQAGATMFDLSMDIFFTTRLVWVIGAPVAFVWLAILFARSGKEFAALEKN